MEYLVVIEKGPTSYGAYVPDLPGVGVVGRSPAEVKRLIRDAVEMHLEGLREDGLTVPRPTARPHHVSVTARSAQRVLRRPRRIERRPAGRSVSRTAR